MDSHLHQQKRAVYTLAPQPIQTLRALMDFLLIFLSWITLTISCFSRYAFGERVMTLERIVLAFMTMKVFGFFLWLFLGLMGLFQGGLGVGSLVGGVRMPGIYMAWFNFYGLVMLVVCLFHWGWIRWLRWRGRVWYSHSFGISRFNFLIWLSKLQPIRALYISDPLLYRIIEPAFWFWAGSWLKGNLDATTGLYIQIAAVALFIEANQAFRHMRNQELDQQDAMIEAAYLQQAREGKPKKETAGFSMVAPAAIPVNLPQTEGNEIESLIENVTGATP